MIDVLNNEPLTFILSNAPPSRDPRGEGRGDRRWNRLVITLGTGKYRLPGIYCYPLHRSGSRSTQSLLNIRRKTRLGSSRASVRPAEPMRLPDVHLHVHVCWRADLASCRSTA